MAPFPVLAKKTSFNFERLLRKEAIDRAVLVGKMLSVLVAVFFVAWVVGEFIKARANARAAELELQNGGGQSAPILPLVGSGAAQDLSILVRQPLLGQIDSGAAAPSPGATPKPISTIPMGLVGTFIHGKKEPYAIIEDKKKSVQDVFRLEEMIFGEAKLKKILSDRVEIERNGQIEQLILDDFADAKSDSKSGVSASGNVFVVEEADLDKALENIPMLLTQARAVPYFKDGISIGLRLFAIKSDSMFEKIGLRNGDILKSVNGSNLGDITQAMKLFEQLKQERNLSVKLEREMEEKEFRYEIK